jgi:hypothetical protein
MRRLLLPGARSGSARTRMRAVNPLTRLVTRSRAARTTRRYPLVHPLWGEIATWWRRSASSRNPMLAGQLENRTLSKPETVVWMERPVSPGTRSRSTDWIWSYRSVNPGATNRRIPRASNTTPSPVTVALHIGQENRPHERCEIPPSTDSRSAAGTSASGPVWLPAIAAHPSSPVPDGCLPALMLRATCTAPIPTIAASPPVR